MIPSQLYALLEQRGINPAAQPVTLMRHQTKRYPLHKYIGTKALTLYQAMQGIRHERGGIMVGFYGHKPGHALLLDIWRVTDVLAPLDALQRGLLKESIEPRQDLEKGYYHELEAMDLLADLRLKLEMQWTAEITWRRVLKADNNYPIWLRHDSAVPFRGIENVSLIMAELRIALQDLEWRQSLGSISGVYLIADERSGRHYVGSACGAWGLWRRWSDYATNGHGNNVELKKLLTEFPGRENDFRLTLLEAMPSSTPKHRVIAREGFWKVALGSRTFGLNRN